MFPREFEYVAPSSLDEALTALASNPGAKVLSGGMSLLPLMKLRLLSPPLLVDIGNLPDLDYITEHDGHVAVGALARHADVAASSMIGEHARAVAQAASWTGDVQVRNRGTLCGAVAHADVAADQPCAVLSLGATMVARSTRGDREIPASEFFIDALTSALEPDEILVEVHIPKGGSSAYDKLGRRGGHTDYAVAGAAAWLAVDDGSIADARVALTGVSTKPVLAPAVAETLRGGPATAEAVVDAASRAAEGVTIIEDLYGSVEYKTHLAGVFAKRALLAALGD